MPRNRSTTKGLIRSLNRSQTESGKAKAAERSGNRLHEPSACERCGAVFARRIWHRGTAVSHALLARAEWTICPACQQSRAGQYFGRVLIRGEAARAQEDLIRRRIANVATRAAASQPQRRVVSIERDGDVLEVLTTSQKLAHRIVHELQKVLGGKVKYAWSDDRSLLATWELPQTAAHSVLGKPRRARGRDARRRIGR